MGIQLLGEKSMSLADSSLTTSARQNPSSTQVLWLILYVANAVAPRIPSVRFGHIVVALLILAADSNRSLEVSCIATHDTACRASVLV